MTVSAAKETMAEALGELVDRYRARTPRSADISDRFRRVLPGGETRAVAYFAPYPVVLERGRGARVWDIDGNEYVDVLNNYTALVHGHAFDPAVSAANRALQAGSVFPAPHPAQLELAELLVSRYPRCELVRFTNSGTEAALLALRVARRATSRQKLVLFRGHYHGTAPEFSEGGDDVVEVEYNDVTALGSAIDDETAAVFVEPFLGSGGVIPARNEFLREIERRAHGVGALFVLDEVQALRTAYHGVHGEAGLSPDLVLMGKIIGGGLPVGAVGGTGDLLALTAADRADGIKHSGTFNGNVATMSAGVANMRALDDAAIRSLNDAAGQLARAIEEAGRQHRLPLIVTRFGSIMHVHFLASAPSTATEANAADPRLGAALHLALLEAGVYAAPRGMLNLSTALSAPDLELVARAYDAALGILASAVAA